MVKGIIIAGIAAIAGISNIVLNNKNTTRSRKSRGSGEIQGTVKWFNSSKGFGFIKRKDGGDDVFVHIRYVRDAGLNTLEDGQAVYFDIVDNGKKGGEAVNISIGRESRGYIEGTVKWFDSSKGFGFIERKDGGDDVFVHVSALRESGLESLDEGQKVTFEIVVNRRKETAVQLQLQ